MNVMFVLYISNVDMKQTKYQNQNIYKKNDICGSHDLYAYVTK